eukprot:3082416-Rhodomonas_salina.1
MHIFGEVNGVGRRRFFLVRKGLKGLNEKETGAMLFRVERKGKKGKKKKERALDLRAFFAALKQRFVNGTGDLGEFSKEGERVFGDIDLLFTGNVLHDELTKAADLRERISIAGLVGHNRTVGIVSFVLHDM